MARAATALAALSLILGAACSPAAEPLDLRYAIASLDEVDAGSAIYLPGNKVYLVDSPTDGLIALSERDPYRGCRITYIDPGDPRRDNSLVHFAETRFVDPCHGSEYDASGYYLAGPSPRSLDRLPLVVEEGLVFFEPSGAIIQVPHPEPLEE